MDNQKIILSYRIDILTFMVILDFERRFMKKTKNKIVKKKNKQVTAYQKALNKKLKQDFPGIKVKNLGDGMSEISFG